MLTVAEARNAFLGRLIAADNRFGGPFAVLARGDDLLEELGCAFHGAGEISTNS